MTAIRVTNFGGIIPRIADRVLPDSAAQYALNAKLLSGELRAWWEPALIQACPAAAGPTAAVDFYPFTSGGNRYFMAFSVPTEVAKAPLLNDAFERLYFTNANGSFVTTKAREIASLPPFRLGVPAPAVPGLTVVPTGGSGTAETRVYTVTLVSAFGEESANGPVITASGFPNGTWTINNLNAVTYDSVTYTNITKLRLYRTITSSTGVDYRQVNEWTLGSVPNPYVDNVAATVVAANPVLESFVWSPPPTGLRGLVPIAGGFMAGFVGRTLFLSHPYYPHAWPEDYQLAVEDDIVALGHYGNTIVIATSGQPYLATGTTPESMSLARYETALPCVSSRGLVSTAASVLYPAPDGLVTVSGGGIDIATRTLCTRDEWLTQFVSPNMVAAVFADRYMAFYGASLGFVLGFEDPTTAFTELQYPGVVTTMHTDRETGEVLLLTSDNNISSWDKTIGLPQTYTWRTKKFMLPKPGNFGALQLRGDFDQDFDIPPTSVPPAAGWSLNVQAVNGALINGPVVPQTTLPPPPDVVTVKVYADNVLRQVISVNSDRPYRLESGYKGHMWELEVSGAVSLFSVVLASTIKELEQIP